MSTIQIPSISYSEGKIHEIQIIIDSKSFNVSYKNNQYEVSPEKSSSDQNNNSESLSKDTSTDITKKSSSNESSSNESKENTSVSKNPKLISILRNQLANTPAT